MQSRDYIFWEVDVQADFILPGGKLYVPGAEKLLPNIRQLTDAARRGEVQRGAAKFFLFLMDAFIRRMILSSSSFRRTA